MGRHLQAVEGSERRAPIRLVLADDHAAVLRSLRAVLDGEEDIEVIGEAQDLATVIGLLAEDPAVLALDPALRGEPGVETLRRLHALAPGAHIVVLTMDDDARLAKRAFAAGACAFVLKELAATELPEAVRDACAGRCYASPRIAARLRRGDC